MLIGTSHEDRAATDKRMEIASSDCWEMDVDINGQMGGWSWLQFGFKLKWIGSGKSGEEQRRGWIKASTARYTVWLMGHPRHLTIGINTWPIRRRINNQIG